MLAKTAFGIALVVATASASVAAPKHHTLAQAASVQNVYNPSGASVTDPDATIRFDLKRDAAHGRY